VFDRSTLRDSRGEGTEAPWDDGWPETAPVGSFGHNALLMYDTLGNVWEAAGSEHDGGFALEMRGGGWHSDRRQARVTARVYWDGSWEPSFGFRPVVPLQR
jgi:formylglycine-generating enzyme required for sulfatase activity